MNPGELNRYVTLQELVTSRDAFGAEILSWSTLAAVWAKIDPLSGGEAYVSDKIQSQATHRFTLYYRSDVTAEHRVVFGGYAYDILLVQEVGLHEATELLVEWTGELIAAATADDPIFSFADDALVTFGDDAIATLSS